MERCFDCADFTCSSNVLIVKLTLCRCSASAKIYPSKITKTRATRIVEKLCPIVGSMKSTHQLGEEFEYAHEPKYANMAKPGKNNNSLIPKEINCLSKAYKNASLFHLPNCFKDFELKFLTVSEIFTFSAFSFSPSLFDLSSSAVSVLPVSSSAIKSPT